MADQATDLLKQRLSEVRNEEKRIEKALQALDGSSRGPGRPPTAKPRQKQKRKGGNRAEHAIALVHKEPGITASVAAERMGIAPNYLYRVLGDLEKEGKVRKEGRKYFPV